MQRGSVWRGRARTRLEILREITMIMVMEEDYMTPQALAWEDLGRHAEDKEGKRGHANAALCISERKVGV